MTTTKLPTDTRPLVRDPDLASAIDKELQRLSGDKLAKAQDAIRQVRMSGLQGTYSEILDAYIAAIKKAAGKE